MNNNQPTTETVQVDLDGSGVYISCRVVRRIKLLIPHGPVKELMVWNPLSSKLLYVKETL